MAHWPKTLRGNVLTVLLIVVGVPLAVFIAISLSGPLVWAGLALVALACVALYRWRRRLEDARERAWVGAFSFGDVVASMRAREALDSLGAMKGSGSAPAAG
jgi:4-amino-4-deoxy-L-arabinose transferase-like glycosyltransferase